MEADAVGILKVTVPVLVAIEKSVPDDPVAKEKLGPEAPLIVVVAMLAEEVVPTVAHDEPFETISLLFRES